MGYERLRYEELSDTHARELFTRANTYLADVYTMLSAPVRKGSSSGACNMSSVLVLLTVVDGLSAYVYPGRASGSPCTVCGRGPARDDAKARFTRLLRERLDWDQTWMEKDRAMAILYLEIRNLLVHELGKDRPSKARPPGTSEPVCGRWGRIPPSARRMSRLDARKTWPKVWPTMEVNPSPVDPKLRVKICCAALYWTIKKMTAELLEDVRAERIFLAERDR